MSSTASSPLGGFWGQDPRAHADTPTPCIDFCGSETGLKQCGNDSSSSSRSRSRSSSSSSSRSRSRSRSGSGSGSGGGGGGGSSSSSSSSSSGSSQDAIFASRNDRKKATI